MNGTTAQVVYVGYTPGYLGTVVTPDGVVVHGTGYIYQPWIGAVYYAPPVTYGVMAQPVYNPMVGVTYGFAMGVATASEAYMWGAVPYYHPAYYGGYPCCGSASASVYGQYSSTTYSGTRTWYANPGGTVGTTATGSYTNIATGTTGSYAAMAGPITLTPARRRQATDGRSPRRAAPRAPTSAAPPTTRRRAPPRGKPPGPSPARAAPPPRPRRPAARAVPAL